MHRMKTYTIAKKPHTVNSILIPPLNIRILQVKMWKSKLIFTISTRRKFPLYELVKGPCLINQNI